MRMLPFCVVMVVGLWSIGCSDSPPTTANDSDVPLVAEDVQGDGLLDLPISDADEGGTTDDAGRDQHETQGDSSLGVQLTITASAVDTCGSWMADHQPSMSYQTPQNIRTGVISVELLRSHRGLNPQSLSLPGEIIEIELSDETELVSTDLGRIEEDSYTHIRIGLAYNIYEVDATAHQGRDQPGTLRFDTALTSYETLEGYSRNQGDIDATFLVMGTPVSTFSQTIPILNCVLSAWGGIASTTDGHFEVIVPLPGRPLVIEHENPQPIHINLEFPMRDAFGWGDIEGVGFAEGVFDVSLGTVEVPEALVECDLFMSDRCQDDVIVPVHPTWPMPDSSIDFCTDGHQVLESCPAEGEVGFGQDGSYAIHPPEFEIDQGIVLDRVTGLQWQQIIPGEAFDWWDARQYCFDLQLGEHTDWRLPSRIEFVTIVDLDGGYPTIDLDVFPDNSADFFWSASPVPFLNLAYGVRFEMGYIYDHDPYTASRVRCVRGSYVLPDPRFNIEDETVQDNGTGLTWQRGVHEVVMIWTDALAACEQLELGDFSDWRLPTLKELQTIVDERRVDPSVDLVAFPDTPIEGFWASTPVRADPNTAWSTSFTDGYSILYATDELHQVRCVR